MFSCAGWMCTAKCGAGDDVMIMQHGDTDREIVRRDIIDDISDNGDTDQWVSLTWCQYGHSMMSH